MPFRSRPPATPPEQPAASRRLSLHRPAAPALPPDRPVPPSPAASPGARREAAPPPRVQRVAPPVAVSAPAGTRLNKRLAELGLCSRREADDWIAHGWVYVNGKVAEMGVKVTPQD